MLVSGYVLFHYLFSFLFGRWVSLLEGRFVSVDCSSLRLRVFLLGAENWICLHVLPWRRRSSLLDGALSVLHFRRLMVPCWIRLATTEQGIGGSGRRRVHAHAFRGGAHGDLRPPAPAPVGRRRHREGPKEQEAPQPSGPTPSGTWRPRPVLVAAAAAAAAPRCTAWRWSCLSPSSSRRCIRW
jgi:hypothetical protein